MDILDIDSLLNDDSFCVMEEKIYDDVTNIIKQWKINNKQNAVFDSRTFTRPKQKNTTNLEPQFKNYMNNFSNNEKMQIGGLVTQRQQQYLLSDTSPPNSKYSSIDLVTNPMFNSLITSADFSNITFLCEEQIPTETVNSKIGYPENLKDQTIFKDGREKIADTLINTDFKHADLDNSLLEDFEFIDQIDKINCKDDFISNTTFQSGNTFKLVENDNKIDIGDTILDPNIKVSDQTYDTSLLNETFNVDAISNNPEVHKCNKLNKKISDIQIEDLLKGSSNTLDLGTPKNNREQHNILAQSTPQNENGSLVIHLSPINSQLKNTKHMEKKSFVNKTFENNYKNFLDDSERSNSEFLSIEKETKNNNLYYDQYKSSESVNIKQSVDAIKKRFSSKIDKPVVQNIALKENSGLPTTTERLLKRGRLYDNIVLQDPESITESKFHEQNNSKLTKCDKPISIEEKVDSDISKIQQTSNNRDRYKTMKIIHKTINKELSCGNDIASETGSSSRFALKNKNSPQNHLSSTFICKTNSASELEHSVCPKECAPLHNQDVKNNMGFKAKSFHNLSSNNFGYSRNLMASSKNEYPDRVSSDDKLCGKVTEVLEVRPTIARRTGLVRPSTGIYSKAITKNNDGLALGYKPKKFEYEENPDKYSIAEINGSTKDTIKYKNDMSRKGRLPESRIRSNNKESGLLRPSNFSKKD